MQGASKRRPPTHGEYYPRTLFKMDAAARRATVLAHFVGEPLTDEQRKHLVMEFGYKAPDNQDMQEKHEIKDENGIVIGMGHGKQNEIGSKSSGSANAETTFMKDSVEKADPGGRDGGTTAGPSRRRLVSHGQAQGHEDREVHGRPDDLERKGRPCADLGVAEHRGGEQGPQGQPALTRPCGESHPGSRTWRCESRKTMATTTTRTGSSGARRWPGGSPSTSSWKDEQETI